MAMRRFDEGKDMRMSNKNMGDGAAIRTFQRTIATDTPLKSALPDKFACPKGKRGRYFLERCR